MDIRKVIKEEVSKVFEGYKTVDSNYIVNRYYILDSVKDMVNVGKKLDQDASENIANLQVLSKGERSGRELAEVGYPTGDVVLFYKSSKGTSGKAKGGWFPIPGFTDGPIPNKNLPEGWFVKVKGVEDRYGIKTFQGTSDYLSATLSEIELPPTNFRNSKPGVPNRFPGTDTQELTNNSQNIPHVIGPPSEFPKEEKFR